MKNKFLALASIFVFIAGMFAFIGGASLAQAQTVTTYPAGCSSSMGYSVTTGIPCSESSVMQTTPYSTAVPPAGCSSALGYSVTNGAPCSGTSTVIPRFLGGCSSALGYSTVNGVPCSGSTTVLQWLKGCSSIYGYSTIDGMPCNGTLTVQNAPMTTIPTTPGLPTTGSGGNALLYTLTLALSAIFAIAGSVYLIRNRKFL
jgi:hypothetical protein